jgi:translation elongation factor EF-Ts
VQVRRLVRFESSNNLAAYVHTNHRIGVLVEVKGGDADFARGVAMHITALNQDQTVEAAAKAAGADVLRFQRLEVGEGIEKVKEDYAAEVMKQAGLA